MKNNETPIADHSPRLRRSKTRDVNSRFLSPSSSFESGTGGLSSPPPTLSPTINKKKFGLTTTTTTTTSTTTTSTETTRKNPSVKEAGTLSGSIRGLWPSSKKIGTLADHLGNDRLKDSLDDGKSSKYNNGPQFLGRQRSCSEFNRFEKAEKEKEKESSYKENHRPIFGGSTRYTGKLRFPGKSSSSSSSKSSLSSTFSNLIVPGRLSVDANNLNRRRNSDSFVEILSPESECSDNSKSPSTYLASTASSRRLAGVEVSSRYLHDATTKSRRGSSDSHSYTADSTHSLNNSLPPKSSMKRASSLTAYKSTISQWALSPGRTGSPPLMSVENKGKQVTSFSSLRPPHGSPSKSKGVSNLFSLGLDLFKTKKSSTNCSSPIGDGVGESSHQLRMHHNRLIQWRYANARANTVNANKMTQAESTLSNARTSLSNLRSSVVQKRIQFGKEKLEFKLNKVLRSQIEPLEAWGDMERQHVSALSTTRDRLHSVVCKVPLIEGAKMDPQWTSVALRQAEHLTTSIKTMLADFSPTAQKDAELLRQLAQVVTVEKSLLQECYDMMGIVSALETQERSLQCSLVQLKSQQQKQCQSRRQQPVNHKALLHKVPHLDC
ncbi:hypothetical protein AQUCO_00800004v1 [Aquilegia coerulea]|uniref:QWRF motif-containing protein 3 n=1 Tax=Aquilegia coerulea TaxID=218851 RepID=A0A2G5EGU4_AQUCA|nr:hypothetical protein AQUCO_00800004v1 [Aquilegia coerulea]